MEIFFGSFIAFYIFHTLGITLGYHRLLSHRAVKVPKWLEYFIVAGGYLTFEGSPIFWVTTHRLHHRYSDQPGDPHSPLDGLWHAFVAWMWKPIVLISSEDSRKIAPDLYRDPVYRLLHCKHTMWDGPLCLTIGIIYRVVIYLVFGPIVLCANLLATAMAFVGPLLVNTVAHIRRFGYQTYDSHDGSRNVWFVAALSMGEGWHNNHHAFPQSARHGLTAKEVDPTWVAIKLLQMLGLAKHVRLPNFQARAMLKNHEISEEIKQIIIKDEAQVSTHR